MNWRNVKTIWYRELRDQLRDRRTLFMVAVLPLLMYPLMGMTFFQLAQFMQSHTAKVQVIGAEQFETAEGFPPLVEGNRFASGLDTPEQLDRLQIVTLEQLAEVSGDSAGSPADGLLASRNYVRSGKLDVVVLFPERFAEQLQQLRRQMISRGETGEPLGKLDIPRPIVWSNSAEDKSKLAGFEVQRVLDAWRNQIIDRNLEESNLPETALQPFQLAYEDVASEAAQSAGVWSKLLPFVVFVWALTGAFYPAVDLCAGEKERGTLETLLVSPALRNELVWGKLLTVIVFSMATALLNLAGLAATGNFISQQMAAAGPFGGAGGLGTPPASAFFWLVVALPPVAALFSALSFACAAFARSTKEGQYYFMPLFLGAMPLMLMPLSPGVELNLGNSFVPVMGLVLLLQSVMEGNLSEALLYVVPVTLVTIGCCLLAIRWAVSQFNQESVLFRGDDRFDLRLWLLKLIRRPAETPSIGMAVTCVAMIFLLQFSVVNTVAPKAVAQFEGFAGFAVGAVISQACVLLPALLMGMLLVSKRTRTFMLQAPRTMALVPAAALLAVLVHPAALSLQAGIRSLYPLSPEVEEQLVGLQAVFEGVPVWYLLPLLALLPAVVEELTFRGFVLAGLRKGGSTFWAVILSAVAFGAVHSVFQQAIAASIVGILIGVIAVVSRSLWPCIAFHAAYNAMGLLAKSVLEWLGEKKLDAVILRAPSGEVIGYHHWTVIACLLLSLVILRWMVAFRDADTGPESPSMPASPNLPRPPVGAPLATPDTSEG